nr:NAC domain-containing protein [Ipomoea batatas]
MEMEIPLGLFFQPFDYDLVRFPFEFVTGTNNSEGLIHEEDIFGDKEPWELIRYGPSENMAYFFTKLKKRGKSMTARRVERTVGKKVKGKKPGNWHGQDKGKPVFDEKGKYVMGYKRCFVYKNRSELEQDGQWLMKEFSLPEMIVKKARAAYPIVEERKDFVLCRVERKKDDEDEDEDDEKLTLEKGGKDLEVETTWPIITPSLSPSPVETLTVADDDINSKLIGVPVEETLALTNDDMNSFLASLAASGDTDGGHDHNISSYFDGVPVPVPVGDTDIISSYLDGVPVPVPVGDTDISSYLDGAPMAEGVPVQVGDRDTSSYLDGVPVPIHVPVPAGDTDMSSYLVDVPMETLIVPGETLAAPADRDQDHHISSGVPVETFPEPGSSSFMDFIFNMEDLGFGNAINDYSVRSKLISTLHASCPVRSKPTCVMEMEIPLGLFFQPFDYDVLRFLFEFVTGTNNSADEEGLIHEEDMFGEKEPWELIRYGPSENMVYFLTKLKKKGKLKTGCRVERTVGKKVKGKKPGNWHGQDKGKPVFDEKGKYVMGYKRCFVYKNRSEPEQDGQWLMKEFSLPETIVKKARAAYPIVEERKDFVLCRVERKKDDEDEDDEKSTTLEQGGKDLEVETTSPIITPSLSPSPVETLTVADDDINSNLIGEETLALTKDDMNSLLASLAAAGDTDGGHDHNINSYFDGVPVPVPVEDTDIISSYLDGVPVHVLAGDTDIITSYLDGVPVPVPVGDTDIIRSYLDGIPVPVLAGDTDMSSYLIDVPMDTLIIPGETLAAPADRDQDHHISSGIPVETFPEPGSSSFMDFIFNMEDVTRLIDFDFDA